MTEQERLLLLGTTQKLVELFGERDDLVVGVTAAFLDLYRALFVAGLDTKNATLVRLGIQRDEINRAIPDGRAARYLQSLIQSLETDRLDAAKLLRVPAAGSA